MYLRVRVRARCFFRRRRWGAGVVLLFGLFIAGLFFTDSWGRFGVGRVPWTRFRDANSLLSGLDSFRAGYNPYYDNRLDRDRSPLSYGPVWLGLAYTGLAARHTAVFGAALVVGFLAALYSFLAPRNMGQALLVTGVLCSPPVLLLVERGNLDLLVFCLLTLGVWLIALGDRGCFFWGGYAALLFACLLKYYPVAAFSVYLRRRPAFGRLAAIGLISLAAFASYAWLLPEVGYGLRTAPRPGGNAFGARVVFLGVASQSARQCLTAACGVIACAAAWLLARTCRVGAGRPEEALFFLAGSAILILCFFSASHFDYRMAFAVMTLPLLFRVSRGGASRLVRAGLFGGLYTMLWGGFLPGRIIPLPDAPVFLNQPPAVLIRQLGSWVFITALMAVFLAAARQGGRGDEMRLEGLGSFTGSLGSGNNPERGRAER